MLYNIKRFIIGIVVIFLINLILTPLLIYLKFEPNWIYFLIIGFFSWWISGFIFHLLFMVMVHKVEIIEFDGEFHFFSIDYNLGFKSYISEGLIKSTDNKPLTNIQLLMIFHNKLTKNLFFKSIHEFCEINYYGKYSFKVTF